MNSHPLTSDWFYSKSQGPGGQVGPLDWEQLVLLARSGALTPYDWVWHPTLADWLPAEQIVELFPSSAAARPSETAPPQDGAVAHEPAAPPEPAAPAETATGRSHLFWVLPLAAVLVVALGLGLFFGLRGIGDGGDLTTSVTTAPVDTTSTVATTAPAEPTSTSTTEAEEPGTWLVMLYQDGDDELLEQDIAFDLNEAELVGSTDLVTIVSQIDRYAGGFDGDGDVTDTKRRLVTQDTDIYTIGSMEAADIGEVDMGDGRSLYDFATWAIDAYPADHYVLIMANHGGGWTGGWSDNDPVEASALTIQEIDSALGSIVEDTGIGAFELIGFDACLMGQLEVMSAIAPHALFGVGSEEIEPGVGWAYGGFLQALTENAAMTGAELGRAVVDAYVEDDIRIVDDEARAELTGGDHTIESVVAEMSLEATMAVIDLSMMQELNSAVNELVLALADVDQALVAEARTYAQSFTGVFGEDFPPSFIDLAHFVDLLMERIDDPQTTRLAEQVNSVLAQSVVAEYHGQNRPASGGLSIYFPNSAEYAGAFGDWPVAYPPSVGRFATASLWDDYLTFHYTGETFDPGMADITAVTPAQSTHTDFSDAAEEAAPAAGADVVGPGAAQLTIAPITVSASEIGQDGTITLSTVVTGSNVAYIYYYVSYYWESDGSYLTADAGFIEPGVAKEMGGTYYPDWGDEDVISVKYDWEPTLFFVSDGNTANDQFAFFDPTTYGAAPEDDVYTVRGTFTFISSGTQIDAEMDFSGNGSMLTVWGVGSAEKSGGAGTWHEITPRAGDTFTITDEYLEFDEDPDGTFVDYLGGTMTFGANPLSMVPYFAYTGDYALGIGVEDLDGNIVWEFTEVTVTE